MYSGAQQFQNDVEVPDYSAKIATKQERLDAITVEDEEAVADYHHVKTQIDSLKEVRQQLPHPTQIVR